jgi:hypothetical protein
MNWKVNLSLGLTASVFTFIFSIENNTWLTSLMRAGLGFLLFFVLAYLLRFFICLISSKKLKNNQKTVVKDQEEADSFQSISLDSLHEENNLDQDIPGGNNQ